MAMRWRLESRGYSFTVLGSLTDLVLVDGVRRAVGVGVVAASAGVGGVLRKALVAVGVTSVVALASGTTLGSNSLRGVREIVLAVTLGARHLA